VAEDPVAAYDAALAAVEACRYEEAARLCRASVEAFAAEGETDSPDVANVLMLLGTAEDELGEHAAAQAHHRRALELLEVFAGASGDLPRLLVQARVGLAGCVRRQGRYAEAEPLLRAALAEAEEAPECGPPDLDEAREQYDRALAELTAAYGPHDPRLAGLFHNLAGLAHSRGDAADAEAWGRRSLALHRSALPAAHPSVVADEAHLGAILEAAGKLDEAEPLLRRAVDYFTERYGPGHYEVAVNLHNLGAVRAGLGALAEAEQLYERALAGKRAALGDAHPEVGLTLTNLAALVAERGDHARALTLAVEAERVLAATVAEQHPARVIAAANVVALAGPA
jgi:tetratricopeptide (TPR) repeat protein